MNGPSKDKMLLAVRYLRRAANQKREAANVAADDKAADRSREILTKRETAKKLDTVANWLEAIT